jgi:hypothetical protein
MRACLLTLLMLCCLNLQWTFAATGRDCAHEICEQLHIGMSDEARQADAGAPSSDIETQAPHCGGCHASVLALPVHVPLRAGIDPDHVQEGPSGWTKALFVARPERPQWPDRA